MAALCSSLLRYVSLRWASEASWLFGLTPVSPPALPLPRSPAPWLGCCASLEARTPCYRCAPTGKHEEEGVEQSLGMSTM